MNLLKTILVTLLASYSFSLQAQDESHYTESISFAQGFAGMKSDVLITAEVNYKLGDYSSIIELLYSTSISDQFIGSILCKQLVNESKIVLTSNQYFRITVIQNSEELLSFHSGCTCHEMISLKEYFSGANPCGFHYNMDAWLITLNKKE